MKKVLVGVLILVSLLGAKDIFSAINKCQDIKNAKLYNFDKVDKQKETPLTRLTKSKCKNRIELAKKIIDGSNILDKPNGFGDTPLIAAIRRGKPYLAKLFIKEGAELNIASKKDGKTPLILATLKRDKDLVRILTERHERIDTKDQNGLTALDYAIKDHLVDIAQLIYGSKRGRYIFLQKDGKPLFMQLTRKGFRVLESKIDHKRILFAYVDKKILKRVCEVVNGKDIAVLAMVGFDSKIKDMSEKKCKNIKLLRFNDKFYLLLMKTLRWRTPPLFLLREKDGRIITSGIDEKFLNSVKH